MYIYLHTFLSLESALGLSKPRGFGLTLGAIPPIGLMGCGEGVGPCCAGDHQGYP